jgi:lysophospholipid acyltransferase (LPLAT)-like uncharacterized protein
LRLLAIVAAMFIRALNSTLRVRHVRAENLDAAPQHILAFWHAHLLLMLHSRWRKPVAVMISRSKDGEIIARVFDSYGGIHAARGSSTRGGGAALRELLREARDGNNLAFTPDGPKGPPRVLKEGVIYAAQATGLPIVPIAFAAKKKSSCAPGTGWSCRIRSRARSSSTASRCSCRVTATSRSGGCAWSAR